MLKAKVRLKSTPLLACQLDGSNLSDFVDVFSKKQGWAVFLQNGSIEVYSEKEFYEKYEVISYFYEPAM